MRGTPRFGRHVYPAQAGKSEPRPEVMRDLAPIPDRNGRLSLALRARWQCPCGAVKKGEFCRNCGRCFAHDVPVNGCDCPMGGD